MSLQEIKNLKSEKGFTIVELLIVIVVIGILAAIVIVAFNGIQTRANNTAAGQAAVNVAKKIESFNAATSGYPAFGSSVTTQLNGQPESSLTGSGITLSTTAPTGDARKTTVYVRICAATTPSATVAATGFQVFRYDFGTNAWQTTPDQSGGVTTACTNATQ